MDLLDNRYDVLYQVDLDEVGAGLTVPPPEPDWRISRIRLSSW